MDNWFDALSKRLAGDVSRRDALRIIVSATVGGLLSSSGLPRLWANTASSVGGQAIAPADVVCPDCGTCEMCDLDAGECGLPCDDPCTAAVLCNTAQTYEPYVTVERYITDFGFTADGEPTALVTLEGGAITMSVLATTYTFTAPLDPSRTATVFFSQDATGEVHAYAITYQDGVPQHGIVVTPEGEFHDVLPPPDQLPLGRAQASTDAQRESSPNPRSAAADKCHRTWELICESTTTTLCYLKSAARCAKSPFPVECMISEVYKVVKCESLAEPECKSFADYMCKCNSIDKRPCGFGGNDCCDPCSFTGKLVLCTADVCTEYFCPPGYTCIDGACTLSCRPPGTPFCHRPDFSSYCPPPGFKCCPQGGHCREDFSCCGNLGEAGCYFPSEDRCCNIDLGVYIVCARDGTCCPPSPAWPLGYCCGGGGYMCTICCQGECDDPRRSCCGDPLICGICRPDPASVEPS